MNLYKAIITIILFGLCSLQVSPSSDNFRKGFFFPKDLQQVTYHPTILKNIDLSNDQTNFSRALDKTNFILTQCPQGSTLFKWVIKYQGATSHRFDLIKNTILSSKVKSTHTKNQLSKIFDEIPTRMSKINRMLYCIAEEIMQLEGQKNNFQIDNPHRIKISRLQAHYAGAAYILHRNLQAGYQAKQKRYTRHARDCCCYLFGLGLLFAGLQCLPNGIYLLATTLANATATP